MKSTIVYGGESRLAKFDVNHDKNVGMACFKIHPRILFHSDTLEKVITLKLPPLG